MGWHDTYFRWDISTPQRVVGRLQELPGQGSLIQPGKKLYAERDRFGKWEHLLGPSERDAQLHRAAPKKNGTDSPARGSSPPWATRAKMTCVGPSEHSRAAGQSVSKPSWPWLEFCLRGRSRYASDSTRPSTWTYGDPSEAQLVLEALRYARWPGQWYAEFQGPPPHTTVAIDEGTKIVGRVYCRNTKLKNGGPRWGKLRFESEQRFTWRGGEASG